MYHGTITSGQRDDELVEAFETLSLDPRRFGHAEHVRLAFALLRRHDLVESLARYRRGLKLFTEKHGASSKYHETVTCALVVLIHERMVAGPPCTRWEDFAEANPDLLIFRGGAFFAYYPADVLDSELARHTFVLPKPGRPTAAAGSEEQAG